MYCTVVFQNNFSQGITLHQIRVEPKKSLVQQFEPPPKIGKKKQSAIKKIGFHSSTVGRYSR